MHLPLNLFHYSLFRLFLSSHVLEFNYFFLYGQFTLGFKFFIYFSTLGDIKWEEEIDSVLSGRRGTAIAPTPRNKGYHPPKVDKKINKYR